MKILITTNSLERFFKISPRSEKIHKRYWGMARNSVVDAAPDGNKNLGVLEEIAYHVTLTKRGNSYSNVEDAKIDKR